MAKMSESIGKLTGDDAAPQFGDYAMDYLAAKLDNPTLRQSTKTSFENQVLKHLIPAFGALQMDKITNAVFLRQVSAMREKGDVTRFFNFRKALIELLTAAKNEGHIEKMPKFDSPDEVRNCGRVLEDKEIAGILFHARRPYRMIFFTFWRMGIRPREILQWRWDMIRWGEPGHSWLKVPARISKTDRKRNVALCPRVSSHLYQRFIRGNRSFFVFPDGKDSSRPLLTYNQEWLRACKLAKVSGAVPYDFRRTLITKWAASNKPMSFAARQLDTSEKLIEKVYLKDDEDAMEGLFDE